MTIARSLARAASMTDMLPVRPTADGQRAARVVGDRVADRVGIIQVPNQVRASTPWRQPRRTDGPNTSIVTSRTSDGHVVRRNSTGTVLSVTFPDGTTRYNPGKTTARTSAVGGSSDRALLDSLLTARPTDD